MPQESKKRRHFTVEKKATILRRHLVDKVSVADLCDEYDVKPSMIYSWQNHLFGNIETALDAGRQRTGAASKETAHAREVEALKARITKKDAVIAEVTEELVGLKKARGEP